MRFLEGRADVLAYTTGAVTEAVEIAGPVGLILHAASTAPDTDFAALLSDVYPDGRSVLLSSGILRATFRGSLVSPTRIEPGRVYLLEVEMADLGHVLRHGHRLRLVLSSALFPYYHPNPNTGEALHAETRRVTATQTVHHGPRHPTRLTLFLREA